METAVLAAISDLLNLVGFEVVETRFDQSAMVHELMVVSTMLAAPCPGCGKATSDRHQCHDRRVSDLPMGGWRTELVVTLYQFKCRDCNKFFTPRYPGLATDGAHATERFLARLAELASHSDVSSAAKFLGIAEKTAEEWFYDYLRRKEKEPAKGLQPVRKLGLDEISLKKDTASSAAC